MIDKIFLISDLHKVEDITALIITDDVEVIVIAGDIVHPEKVFDHFAQFFLPVIIVLGNHDYWNLDISDAVDNLKCLAEHYDDIYVLDNECVEIQDTRFIGATLWTSYGDWHPRLVLESQAYLADNWKITAKRWWSEPDNKRYARELLQQLITDARKHNQLRDSLYELDEWMSKLIDAGKFHPIIGSQLHMQSISFIKDQLAKSFDGQTCVITHHPPIWEGIRTKYLSGKEVNPDSWNHCRFFPGGDRFHMGPLDPEIAGGYGSPNEELFIKLGRYQHRLDGRHWEGDGDLVGADVWLHGHIHDNFEYSLHGTRFVVNALKSHRYKPEKNVITISDGLRYTFSDAVRRTTTKLDKVIAELTQWTECNEIETIQSVQIKNAVLSRLAGSYNFALTALREFELEFERITGIRRSPTDLIKLFNIELNSNKFSLIHSHPFINSDDKRMLSLAFIVSAIDDLKAEKDSLSQYGWKNLPNNWKSIKSKLEQRQQSISPELVETELRSGTVLYDFHISVSDSLMMIFGFDANNGYRITPSPITLYDEVTGIGRLELGGIFQTIGSSSHL